MTAAQAAAALLPLHIEHTISSMSVDAIVATRPPPPRPSRLPWILGAALSLLTAGAGVFAVTTLQQTAAMAEPVLGPVTTPRWSAAEAAVETAAPTPPESEDGTEDEAPEAQTSSRAVSPSAATTADPAPSPEEDGGKEDGETDPQPAAPKGGGPEPWDPMSYR